MRLQFTISANAENGMELPGSYRQGIASIIKEAVNTQDKKLFETLFAEPKKNKTKPFTFAVYIPKAQSKPNNIVISPDAFLLVTFATSNMDIFMAVYNGLRDIRKYKLYSHEVQIKSISYKKEVELKNSKIRMKTISPLLVRDYNDKNRYLLPDDDGYYSQLYKSISAQHAKLLGKEYSGEIKVEIEKFKPVKLMHYKSFVQGTNAQLVIEAESEVLKMIYDTGIGSRRSEGFGMLEVISDEA